MILYDKKDNSLGVYNFSADRKILIDYRMSQMEKIPESERIVIAKTRIDFYGEIPLFETKNGRNEIQQADYADRKDRENENPYRRYHALIFDRRSERNNEFLLDCYYYGNLENKNVARIQYLKLMKYFLLKKDHYDYLDTLKVNDSQNYRMDEIIQLPESLYILQLLEQGKFLPLEGMNISEQLALYNLEKINEISLEELQKMDDCRITQDVYSQVVTKANNDDVVLKLLKK